MIAATHGEATNEHDQQPEDHREHREELCRRVSASWTSSSGSFTRLLYPAVSWVLAGEAIDDGPGALPRRPGRLQERRQPCQTFPSQDSRTSRFTSAMASHGIRRSRKASTATSLAALRAAGAPPPRRPAS